MIIYRILDYFFIIFHSLLVIFNLFGWIWAKTRIWNLITLLITAGSWFILGIFYGWGYCFLTDWHWTVLEKIDKGVGLNSYIQYLVYRLTGWTPDADLVDVLTIVLFFVALVLSLVLNGKDWKRKKRNK